jgi:hypothetical protein
MIIKAVIEQFYNINDVEYKFVKGENLGCGECDLYNTLKARGDCVFACTYGHMERCYKSAAIICPYCNATITYPIYKEGGTRCKNCDGIFKIDYINKSYSYIKRPA